MRFTRWRNHTGTTHILMREHDRYLCGREHDERWMKLTLYKIGTCRACRNVERSLEHMGYKERYSWERKRRYGD